MSNKILAGLGLAILIAGAAYFGFVRRYDSPSVSPTPITDASGWQTYRYEEHGFELKIPAGWSVDVYRGPDIQISFISPQTKASVEKVLRDCNDSNPSTPCIAEALGKDITFTDHQFDKVPDSDVSVKLGNAVFTRYREAFSMFDSLHYSITRNGRTYDFSADTPTGEETIDQILSTFRFTK